MRLSASKILPLSPGCERPLWGPPTTPDQPAGVVIAFFAGSGSVARQRVLRGRAAWNLLRACRTGIPHHSAGTNGTQARPELHPPPAIGAATGSPEASTGTSGQSATRSYSVMCAPRFTVAINHAWSPDAAGAVLDARRVDGRAHRGLRLDALTKGGGREHE